jgi:hypothetical protein
MDSIYLLHPDGELVPVQLAPYEFEDEIQRLLEHHPELLPGTQIDPESPLRWLLVKREAGVPAEEGGGGWWALDHLFVDQHGVPTLVEIKRSSDTRARREVVAQMLEYAANGTAYWDVGVLQAWFEETTKSTGLDPESILSTHIGGTELSHDQFWDRVRDNLRAGHVRCVFLADSISPTLRRLVEFLNEHLDTVEVLAVELPQYASTDGSWRALVPRLVGQTERARAAKGTAPSASRQWNVESFMAEVDSRLSPKDAATFRTVLEWCKVHAVVRWGRGVMYPGFRPVIANAGRKYVPFNVWLDLSTNRGSIEIDFEYLKSSPAFSVRERRLELLSRLNQLGLSIPAERIDGRPSVALESLRDEPVLTNFLGTMEWVVGVITRDDPDLAAEPTSG